MDIVGLGTPVMDQLVNIPYMPKEDGMVAVNEVFWQGGGKVASGLTAAARLGAQVGMLARIGGDFTGEYIIKDFAYHGVDVSHLLRGSPNTSSSYSIAVSEEETGTRVFLIRPGTVQPLTAGEVDFDYIATAKCLHLEHGDEASTAAARFAKEKGILVSIDGDQFTDGIEQLLPYIDIFIGSEFYHRERYAGEDSRTSCEDILRRGPSVAWFTRGEKGCVGLADGEYHDLPCFPVNVRDTTGAGDVFHGAYLARLLEGRPHKECAMAASAAAALKCMYVGGRTSAPNRETLDRYLRDGVIDTAEFDERLRYYRANF